MDLNNLRGYKAFVAAALALCSLFSFSRAQNDLELEYNSSTLAGNSLLLFSDLEEASSSVVRCLAPGQDCCRSSDTPPGEEGLGQWLLPDGSALSELQGASLEDQLYFLRENGSLDLYRRNNMTALLQEGIYTCEIPNSSGQTERAYLGLYREGNGLPVITSLEFDHTSAAVTCTSVGGPVTNITWMVGDVVVPFNGTVISDSLTVEDRVAGTYMAVLRGVHANDLLGQVECIVSNARGESRKNITVDTTFPHFPSIMSATPTSTTANIVWQGATFGLVITYYQVNVTYLGPCGDVNDTQRSIRVNGPASSHEVTNLLPNSAYLVTIMALNVRGRSESDSIMFNTLTSDPTGMVQNIRETNITMTTISLSWEPLPCLSRNSNITGYQVDWSTPLYADGTVNLEASGTGIESYTIQNLIPGTEYTISVRGNSSENLLGPIATLLNTTHRASEPTLFLNGQIISNNSIIDPASIGEGDRALFCLTDLAGCCRRKDHPELAGPGGDWFYAEGGNIPTRTNLGAGAGPGSLYENRGMSTTRLNRLSDEGISLAVGEGLFTCVIPNKDGSNSTLFVGLYNTSQGGRLSSQLLYDTSSTSLICRSTGGPATSVTWFDEGGEQINTSELEVSQVVVNTSLTWYDTSLRLTAVREEDNLRRYSCIVTNSRSNSSATVQVKKPILPPNITVRIGMRSEFNCSTPDGFTANTIAWHNNTGEVIAMAMNSMVATLVLAPPPLSADGATYSCRMTNGITVNTTVQLQASAPPTNLQANMTTPTSVTFQWAEPDGAVPVYLIYSLSCQPMLMGLTSLSKTTLPGDTRTTLMGMEEGVAYTCRLKVEINEFLSDPSNEVSATTITIAPTAGPASFGIRDVTARTAMFSWQPVPLLARNGDITNYALHCIPSSSLPHVGVVTSNYAQTGSYTVSGFYPDTEYLCSVSAINSAGVGPSSANVSASFMDDDSTFQIQFQVTDCNSWVISGVPQKRADIEAAITARLSLQCACTLDSDPAFLQNGRFVGCTDPSRVTYRATIQGTSSLSSRELVSEIQLWVNEDPVITVASVEMNVNSQCPVNSFEDSKCSPTPAPISLPIIVGAVVGGVIVVTVCAIGVVILVFCCKRRRGSKSLSSNSRERNTNLDLTPYRVTLQNMNVTSDNSSDDENYAHIPPQLPARPSSVSDVRSNSTSFKKLHTRSASQHSVRYIRDPRTGKKDADEVTDGKYAEIDIANSSRLKQRRPSDYEAVLVRNVGLMSTEALNSLSPTALSRDGIENPDEDGLAKQKLGAFEMPRLHPCWDTDGNDYEVMRNAGFRNRSGTSPDMDTRNATTEDVVNADEDESEVIRNARAMSISTTAANPMYSATSSSTLNVVNSPKRISESNLDNWSCSPRRGSDGYSIPSKVKRPDQTTDASSGQMSDNSDTPNVLYNIPTIPAQPSDLRNPLPAQTSSNENPLPGHHASNNPIVKTIPKTSTDATPTSHHPNHVLYNIPTLPAQSVGGVASVPPSSHGNTKSHADNGPLDPLTYDVPPIRHGTGNISSDQANSNSTTNINTDVGSTWNGNGTYDIPKSGTNQSALYDVPTSSAKLEGNVIPGIGSSEHFIH